MILLACMLGNRSRRACEKSERGRNKMKQWLSRVFVSSMAMMLVFSSVPILDAQAVDTADHATVTAETTKTHEKKEKENYL